MQKISNLRRALYVIVVLAFTMLPGTSASTQPVSSSTQTIPIGFSFVKDINTNSNESWPICLYAHQGTLYFAAWTRESGREIWVSNGTETGTRLLKDIRIGQEGQTWPSTCKIFGSLNGELYFAANDGTDSSIDLWKSDGTEAGTQQVKELSITDSAPFGFLAFNNWLYFFTGTRYNYRMWRTDGTTKNTYPVSDLTFGEYVGDPIIFNNALYISAQEPGSDGHGLELWRTTQDLSDGSPGPMQRVTDINQSGSSWPSDLTLFQDGLFFTAYDPAETGREIWKLDANGNLQVFDNFPGVDSSSPGHLEVFQDILYFSARDAEHGTELWKSDGTLPGTGMVVDLNPGESISSPQFLTATNYGLYFAGQTALNGSGIFRFDGNSVEKLANGQALNLTSAGDVLYFTMTDQNELWRSGPEHGAASAGTYVVKTSLGLPASNPLFMTWMDGILYFQANDGVHSTEIYRSDGTDAGTQLVKDINPESGDDHIIAPTPLGKKLFFFADSYPEGIEPWISDGTEAGTFLLSDVNPQGNGAYLDDMINMHLKQLPVTTDGIVYFLGRGADNSQQLWRSEGTQESTSMVGPIVGDLSAMVGLGGELVALETGQNEVTLRCTTQRGKSGLEPCGNFPGVSVLPQLAARDGWVYLLIQNNTTNQAELWRTQGANHAPELVKPIAGSALLTAPAIAATESLVFFVADGTLWQSDGTAEGTVELPNPEAPSALDPQQMFVLNNRLYFTTHIYLPESNNGEVLYLTKGIDEGISRLGFYTSPIQSFTGYDGILYYTATDPYRKTVWRNDGTPTGTRRVCLACSNNQLYADGDIAVYRKRVFYKGGESLNDYEVWATDGTPAGTVQVANLEPAMSSYPKLFTTVDDLLFLVAMDQKHSYGLWVMKMGDTFLPVISR